MPSPTVRLRDIAPSSRVTSWERVKYSRLHWFTELFAEALGVFLYVYAGVGATAAFTVGNITAEPIGSFFTVGFAYTLGIVLAISICAAASGGHFNPGVTLSFVVLRGFPITKAARYIVAQIFGGFVACLLVYAQWKDLIVAAEEVLKQKGIYDTVLFTPSGPAGIFALYTVPGTNLQRVLLNEFVTDFVIGLTICAGLDPTNHMIPPACAPWVIGFAYGMAIWGFAPTGLATNTARDLGARLMAMIIWGTPAAGGPYAAIAGLTNIAATIMAFVTYEHLLGSSLRTLSPSHVAFLRGHKQYHEYVGLAPEGYLAALETPAESAAATSSSFDDKHGHTEMLEVAGNV